MTSRLRSERGEALVEALLLLSGALLPLFALIALAAQLELARLNVDQAARDAARAASQQATQPATLHAAETAVQRAQQQGHSRLVLQLQGTLTPGTTLTASVSTSVALLPGLPLFGSLGTVSIRGQASIPVDRYRSLIARP